MQIYMKPKRHERDALASRMEAARNRLGISLAALADSADVDPSQVSRICRGEFATLSDSVVRICRSLGVDVPDGAPAARRREGPGADPSWAKLQRALRRAWDRTPEGADLLARILLAVRTSPNARAGKANPRLPRPAPPSEGGKQTPDGYAPREKGEVP